MPATGRGSGAFPGRPKPADSPRRVTVGAACATEYHQGRPGSVRSLVIISAGRVETDDWYPPRMNVLFLPYYDDNPYQDELSRGLEQQGVHVVTGDYTEPLPVLQAVAEHGLPDVIHLHWAHSLLVTKDRTTSLLLALRLFLELAVARAMGVRIVWTVHNRLQHDRRFPRLEARLRGYLARVCDDIIVHGYAARQAVMDTYGLAPNHAESIHVVPHGSYVDCYENTSTRQSAREELGVDPDATVFLFFGNIRPYKNVPALVRAFRELEDDDARLLVVGRPPDEDEARRELVEACDRDDRVSTEFGFIPEAEIQLYMNAADAVVLPFEKVLTSGSVVLAMSFGRPVVAPRLGCIPELVGDTDDFLYDPAADDGLVRALRRATEADLDTLGDAAFRRARRFDWVDIAGRTAEIYRGEASTPAPPSDRPDLVTG